MFKLIFYEYLSVNLPRELESVESGVGKNDISTYAKELSDGVTVSTRGRRLT
ncbi:MAG: hypothetical protein P4M11_02790 [Candidatus Pacebacteria bacterium]|nr:hypothetical protein [Candidatus Paceibacterota bacterium]